MHQERNSAPMVGPDKGRDFSGRKPVDTTECEQSVPVRSLLPLLHHSCTATVVIAVQAVQVNIGPHLTVERVLQLPAAPGILLAQDELESIHHCCGTGPGSGSPFKPLGQIIEHLSLLLAPHHVTLHPCLQATVLGRGRVAAQFLDAPDHHRVGRQRLAQVGQRVVVLRLDVL